MKPTRIVQFVLAVLLAAPVAVFTRPCCAQAAPSAQLQLTAERCCPGPHCAMSQSDRRTDLEAAQLSTIATLSQTVIRDLSALAPSAVTSTLDWLASAPDADHAPLVSFSSFVSQPLRL